MNDLPNEDRLFEGHRMSRQPRRGVVAHEMTDHAGRVYFEDGTMVRWIRVYERRGYVYTVVPLGANGVHSKCR